MKNEKIAFNVYLWAMMLMTVFCFTAYADIETAENLEPVEIELPDPFFGGTPCEHWSPRFEPYDYRDRPPFLAPAGTTNVALNKGSASKKLVL